MYMTIHRVCPLLRTSIICSASFLRKHSSPIKWSCLSWWLQPSLKDFPTRACEECCLLHLVSLYWDDVKLRLLLAISFSNLQEACPQSEGMRATYKREQIWLNNITQDPDDVVLSLWIQPYMQERSIPRCLSYLSTTIVGFLVSMIWGYFFF